MTEKITEKKLNGKFNIDELTFDKSLESLRPCYYHLLDGYLNPKAGSTLEIIINILNNLDLIGKENNINLTKQINFPSSLGLLYSALTAYLLTKTMALVGTIEFAKSCKSFLFSR
jgi:hypothetical protein